MNIKPSDSDEQGTANSLHQLVSRCRVSQWRRNLLLGFGGGLVITIGGGLIYGGPLIEQK